MKNFTGKSIFLNIQTLILLLSFFSIRVISYALHNHLFTQAVVVFIFLMVFGLIYFKNTDYAFYILFAEIFLGGSGNLLEFYGLSVRTLLIAAFLIMWTVQTISERKSRQYLLFNRPFTVIMVILYCLIVFSILNGIFNGHRLREIIQDTIPFLYLPLVYPAYRLLAKQKTQDFLIRLVIVFIIGSAIFSLFTLFLFSSQVVLLQQPYYKWFRDIAAGKITDMGNNLFRVVLPEHLLITPIILIISSLLMRDEKHHKMWRLLLIFAIIILMLNLSRAFLLALAVGFVILKLKHKWQRWLIITSTTAALLLLIFASLSILTSGGKTLGLEVFGLRLASFSAPQIETSTATRMMILPAILNKISNNPILGQGLGASIIFYNTASGENVTTGHFDWGYLEMLAELGLIGTAAFMVLILFIIYRIRKKIIYAYDWQDFYVGIFAGIIALLVINITTPALFHTFGIIFLIMVLALALKPINIFEKLVTSLYRIFNRWEK